MPAVLVFVYFCFLLISFQTAAEAGISEINLDGVFDVSQRRFKGAVRFTVNLNGDGRFLLHLPPNWHSKSDRREIFPMFDYGDAPRMVNRSELKALKTYQSENLHLASKIDIHSVKAYGQRLAYRILDNPHAIPRRNSESSLLSFNLPITSKTVSNVLIEIAFTTHFNKLPKGFKRILWDFAPRPVGKSGNGWDYKDIYHFQRLYKTKISIVGENQSEKSRRIETSDLMSKPLAMTDNWAISNRWYHLSTEAFLENRLDFYERRLNRVLEFLIQDGWILKSSFPIRFIIWDGPTTVSGIHILLSRRLFRYSEIFYKLFEVAILNSTISSVVHKNYLVDSYSNPWILPAIQGEIIRRYFSTVHKGNRRLFPWLNWLNPDFIEEYTILGWLNNKDSKTLVAADESFDWTYFSHIYHPWHAKGFHLLRMISGSQSSFELEIYPKLRNLLKIQLPVQEFLSKREFFHMFSPDGKYAEQGEFWLSTKGTVDYEIKDVNIAVIQSGFLIQVEIGNSGTISPWVEIEFAGVDGSNAKKVVHPGEGIYSFQLEFEPQEIVLDPESYLLEEERLNNHWQLQIKVRPLWDFSSSNRWLFAISPLISGNTFDQNLFGVNFNLSYLVRSGIDMSVWRRGKDAEPLWEGELFHIGFPFKGSKIYYESSQLGASNTRIFGFEQSFDHYNPDLLADFNIWEDDLEILEANETLEERRRWIGTQAFARLPVFEGDFSQWNIQFAMNSGRSADEIELKYQQHTMENAFEWSWEVLDFHIALSQGFSYGTVPLQKLYPIGGPEGLPGFPRELDLLFYHRQIAKAGIMLPALFTHTNIHLLRLLWLDRIEPTLNFRYGSGLNKIENESWHFRDVELKLDVYGEFINMYEGYTTISIAQPIDHSKYKDYRIILFSSWVF